MQQLNDEEYKITKEMMEGKNFDENMQKLKENQAKRQNLKDKASEKAQQERQRKRKEMGETQYEKDVKEIQARMTEVLREILTLPSQFKQLEAARKTLVNNYKKEDKSFKITAENAKTEKSVQHFGRMRQLGAQVARVNVMLAEAKLGVKVGIDEFNHLKNRHDRLVGAKGFWSFVGNHIIGEIQNQMNTAAVDIEARAIATQAP